VQDQAGLGPDGSHTGRAR